MQDIEVISSYKEQISWGDETEVVQCGDRHLMKCNESIYLPCHHGSVRIPDLMFYRALFGVSTATAIVWGNPSKEEAQAICWQLMKARISVVFIDAVGRVAWSQFVLRALDGVDWNRTLPRVIAEGADAKPVMEWDE